LTDTSKGGTIAPEEVRQAVLLLNAGQHPAVEAARELGGDVMILIVLCLW
jgi:predicted amino acid dehydrogenase